jgi:hypothetical protein
MAVRVDKNLSGNAAQPQKQRLPAYNSLMLLHVENAPHPMAFKRKKIGRMVKEGRKAKES